MRRCFFLLASVLLLLSLLLSGACAAETTPVIALTSTPAYGAAAPFEGVVFREDGGAFDTGAYKVSVYLEQPGLFWCKPSNDRPAVELDGKGRFSVSYDPAIQSDREGTLFHFLLIPAGFTPAPSSSADDFQKTVAASVDHVTVTRAQGAENVVTPSRPAPVPDPENVAPALPSGLLPVKQDKIAVDVGFYTDGTYPDGPLSADLIRRHLAAVSAFSDTVRFYKAGGETAKAYQIAHDMGFTVLGNAWLSSDKAANTVEMDALTALCNKGLVDVAIVGSEVLLRGSRGEPSLSAEELVEAIEYVRAGLEDKTIPVTTADSVDQLLASRFVRNACNLLMPNCYPYWGGSGIDQAASHFISNIEALREAGGGKEIVVSETGWPTAGQTVNETAKAGEAEAARYYAAVRDWSLSSNTQVLYFASADEPWKRSDENEAGAHWGFMTTKFALKDGYADLTPFAAASGGGAAAYAVELVSSTDGTATLSLANRTGGAVTALFAVCACDGAGRMISCNVEEKTLAPSASAALAVTYGADSAASSVRAYVLDAGTLAPLRDAFAAKLPR